MKIVAVLKQELHMLTRGHTPLLLIIFLVPLCFSILFGVAYHENVVKRIPMIIYDQDQSPLSRTLIQSYHDSERFAIVAYVDSQEKMEEKLYTGEGLTALAIPRNFSKNTKLGLGSEIVFVANSDNNMFANAALSAAQEINRTFSIGVGQRLLEGLGQIPSEALSESYPIHFGIRILNNPTNGYTPFMLSGLMLNGLQIALMLVAGPLLIREINKPSYGTDVSSRLILLGKGLLCWLAGFFSYGISLGVLHVFFDVSIRGDIIELAIIGGAFIFFVISVLFVFAVCSPDEVMAMQTPLLYIMPGLLFSGLSWPDFAMNSVSALFAALLPMAYAADSLRDLLLAGYTPQLWQNTLAMLGLGGLCFYVSSLIFSYRRFHRPRDLSRRLIQKLCHFREGGMP